MEASGGLIDKIFVTPVPSLKTNEVELVCGVLHIMQGFSSNLFHWDHSEQRFCVKKGIYVMHLSQTSLNGVVDQFVYAATCLQLVENVLTKVGKSASAPPPTLRALTCCVSSWLSAYEMLL